MALVPAPLSSGFSLAVPGAVQTSQSLKKYKVLRVGQNQTYTLKSTCSWQKHIKSSGEAGSIAFSVPEPAVAVLDFPLGCNSAIPTDLKEEIPMEMIGQTKHRGSWDWPQSHPCFGQLRIFYRIATDDTWSAGHALLPSCQRRDVQVKHKYKYFHKDLEKGLFGASLWQG